MRRAVRLLACSGCWLLGSGLQPGQAPQHPDGRPAAPSGHAAPPRSTGGSGGHLTEGPAPPVVVQARGRGAPRGLVGAQSSTSSTAALLQLVERVPGGEHRSIPSLRHGRASEPAAGHAGSRLGISTGHEFLVVYWGSVIVISVAGYFIWYSGEHRHLSHVNIACNAYSLVLFAAVQQAKLGYFHQSSFKPVPALAFCIVVSLFQITLVYLLVSGIDPHSLALAKEPAQEWMTEAHLRTVSAMKWLMTFVLVLKTTGEVEESKATMRISLEISEKRLCCSRWLPFISGMMQYVVSLMIVYAGCAAVLSFQETPDIVYSGLAVCFVADVDDLCYQYFTVTMRRIICNEEIDMEDPEGDDWSTSAWYHYLLRLLSFLPCLVAFYVVGRAFLTGNTPIRLLHRNGLTPHVQD